MALRQERILNQESPPENELRWAYYNKGLGYMFEKQLNTWVQHLAARMETWHRHLAGLAA